MENAQKVGEYLLKNLIDVAEESQGLLTNVRGRGLMCAFDLPTTELRDKFRKELYKSKILILACGAKSIRFRPPLCMDEEHIDEGLAIFSECCKSAK